MTYIEFISITDLDLIVTVLRHNVQKETMFSLANKSRFDAGFDYFGCHFNYHISFR